MALIDKETIRAEIDKRYAEYRAKMKTDDFTYYEGMADALDLFEQFINTLPVQPVEGLDAEIGRYWNWVTGFQPSFAVLELTREDLAKVARHFYELGCTRTAVMYDDIEYERQRAEEAELSGDLEEEYKNYVDNDLVYSKLVNRNAGLGIARHFAEWGATHLKR